MAPLVDPGTDCEDKLSTPAGPPADVIHRMDSELEEVFGDVGSLPTMVTPVCDIDGALRVSPPEGPVIAPPAVSAFVIRPSMATSPAGPKTLSLELFLPSPASVGVSSVPRISPEFMLFNAAITSQTQPEAGPSFTEDLASGLFPAIPLTPGPEAASRHGDELDSVADLSREGPFDIHQDHLRSVASPQLMQDTLLLMRAEVIQRKCCLQKQELFSGYFSPDCLTSPVPEELRSFINIILQSPSILQGQT